ncbi:MAG TPA: hypothetical protein VIY90_00845 [Steroidobacteraceae bacterium]
MVITGFAGSDMGTRGRIKAYDARSGELRWTFYTVPGPGQFGHDTVSIVALDVKTGKYRWHFQEVHHDLWDYDAPNPVVLFDAPFHGRMCKGLVEAGKTGYVLQIAAQNPAP